MNTPNLIAVGSTYTEVSSVDGAMHMIDLAILVLYAIGIVALGVFSGHKVNRKSSGSGGEAENYFLAGGTLKWPVIGLALFATNISTVHLIGLAQSGYDLGVTQGNFELMAGVCLAILAIFFAPFFIRSQVATLPDFLEKRYSQSSRDIFTVLSILSAILIHIGFSLYTGAVVINGMFGINLDITTSILIIAALTGVYTIIGGLTAVVVTESIQTVIMLLGTLIITVIAFNKAGGWDGMVSNIPGGHMTMFADDYQGAGKLRWFSFVPGYLILGIWYWCTDQTIVQRVLGAKDENQARLGALFAGFLKLLPLFIIVLPGVLCYSLIQQGKLEGAGFESKDTYVFMIKNLMPVGLKGLLAATLLSAVMSTVSGALNSIGTLVSYDLIKRRNPGVSDGKLISAGRMASTIALVLAIVWSATLNPTGIFTKIQSVIVNIAPPITCVFLFGVFWKKASAKASTITLIFGSVIGMAVFMLNENFFMEKGPDSIGTRWATWLDANYLEYMLVGVYSFILCCVVMVVCSYLFPHQHTEESRGLTWDSPLEALQGEASKGLTNYKFLAAVLLAAVVVIYIWFW